MPLPAYEYVAIQEIWHDGVRAYNVGDPVPAGNVNEHGYDKAGVVAKAGSKAAQQVTGQADQTPNSES